MKKIVSYFVEQILNAIKVFLCGTKVLLCISNYVIIIIELVNEFY